MYRGMETIITIAFVVVAGGAIISSLIKLKNKDKKDK